MQWWIGQIWGRVKMPKSNQPSNSISTSTLSKYIGHLQSIPTDRFVKTVRDKHNLSPEGMANRLAIHQTGPTPRSSHNTRAAVHLLTKYLKGSWMEALRFRTRQDTWGWPNKIKSTCCKMSKRIVTMIMLWVPGHFIGLKTLTKQVTPEHLNNHLSAQCLPKESRRCRPLRNQYRLRWREKLPVLVLPIICDKRARKRPSKHRMHLLLNGFGLPSHEARLSLQRHRRNNLRERTS